MLVSCSLDVNTYNKPKRNNRHNVTQQNDVLLSHLRIFVSCAV